MPNTNKEEYNEYMKGYMLNKYYERREEAFQYLGGKCKKCGSKKELEIDHIDWTKKTIALNKLWSCAKKKFWEELDKCQLLCKDCHIEKSKTDLREIRKIKPGRNQYSKPL